MIRVGLVDSGVAPEQARHVVAARSFTGRPLSADRLGHGSAVARIILGHRPDAALLNAQTFGTTPATAEAVAAALAWLIAEGARVVNLSLGLRHDRVVLRAAVEAALDAGLILLASLPARGPVPYPAGYPGVIRITGDARCASDQLSSLGGDPADFGACVLDPSGRARGASHAVANATGLLLCELARGDDPLAALARRVVHRGRERRC